MGLVLAQELWEAMAIISKLGHSVTSVEPPRALFPFAPITGNIPDRGCRQLGSQSEDDAKSPRPPCNGARGKCKPLWVEATESWECLCL